MVPRGGVLMTKITHTRLQFSRGFVAAARALEEPLSPRIVDGISELRGMTPAELERVAAGSPNQATAVTTFLWLQDEGKLTLDRVVDIHWSHLGPRLSLEPWALLAQLLQSFRPSVARAIRLEIPAASPVDTVVVPGSRGWDNGLAVQQRQLLLANFLAARPRGSQSPLARLILRISSRDVWTVLRKIGLGEIARAGLHREARRLLAELRTIPGLEGEHLRRVFRSSGRDAADLDAPEQMTAAGIRLNEDASIECSCRHLQAALGAAKGHGASVFVTLVAMHKFAAILGKVPEVCTRHLVQILPASLGPELRRFILGWKETVAIGSEHIPAELVETLRASRAAARDIRTEAEPLPPGPEAT